jgi:uncharacterized protein YjbI with pentapeptide repeats
VADVIQPVVQDRGPRKFTGKFNRANFRGQSLVRADFRGASLCEADFTDTDCSFANFEGADCWGARFTNANLHRANFRDAVLANAYLDARDTFGITLTMSCDTFNGMHAGYLWWGYLFFATMMQGPDDIAADKLIAAFGKERYLKYSDHFRTRVL